MSFLRPLVAMCFVLVILTNLTPVFCIRTAYGRVHLKSQKRSTDKHLFATIFDLLYSLCTLESPTD